MHRAVPRATLLVCLFCCALAFAQQPSSSSSSSAQPSSPSTQVDQHPMASAMVSADRKTQGPAAAPKPIVNEVVIKGGTIMTATHGVIQNGSIHIKNGKIVAAGA